MELTLLSTLCACKRQLQEALAAPRQTLVKYTLRRYGSLTLMTDEGTAEIPTKPKQVIYVRWAYADNGDQDIVYVQLQQTKIIIDWPAEKFIKWLNRNANVGEYCNAENTTD